MARSTQPKKYWVVSVGFKDHAELKEEGHTCQKCQTKFGPNDYVEPECFVIGILVTETKDAYHLSSWITDHDPGDWNARTDTVLKSAVITPLKYLFELEQI